jgi:hypothetical protein
MFTKPEEDDWIGIISPLYDEISKNSLNNSFPVFLVKV